MFFFLVLFEEILFNLLLLIFVKNVIFFWVNVLFMEDFSGDCFFVGGEIVLESCCVLFWYCIIELFGSDVEIFLEREGEFGLLIENFWLIRLLKFRGYFWFVDRGDDFVFYCFLEYFGCFVFWFGMGMGLDICLIGGDMSLYIVDFVFCFWMFVFLYKVLKFVFCCLGLLLLVKELSFLMLILEE